MGSDENAEEPPRAAEMKRAGKNPRPHPLTLREMSFRRDTDTATLANFGFSFKLAHYTEHGVMQTVSPQNTSAAPGTRDWQSASFSHSPQKKSLEPRAAGRLQTMSPPCRCKQTPSGKGPAHGQRTLVSDSKLQKSPATGHIGQAPVSASQSPHSHGLHVVSPVISA